MLKTTRNLQVHNTQLSRIKSQNMEPLLYQKRANGMPNWGNQFNNAEGIKKPLIKSIGVYYYGHVDWTHVSNLSYICTGCRGGWLSSSL